MTPGIARAVERLAASRLGLRQALHTPAARAGRTGPDTSVLALLLRPWATRHPLRLVAGAALAGALLAWSRAWTGRERSGRWWRLGRRVLRAAVAQAWPPR